MTVVYILAGILVVLLAVEAWLNRRGTGSIPVRIHVNGTRGKSSVTRYITVALQSSGLNAMGKVTGETPMLIGKGGDEREVRRLAPPRVNEQFRIIRRAARDKADALVLECMSVDPVLQQTESRYFRPGICVIPNIRDDHREKMGHTQADRVAAICSSIPRGSVVVSNDTPNLEAIRQEADRKNSRLVIPGRLDQATLGKLPRGVFAPNIELAVETAVLAGAGRETALNGILGSLKEGEKLLFRLGEPGDRKFFLNAFKVNDPDSASEFIQYWREKAGAGGSMAVVFHTRADRPLRTESFAAWLIAQHESISCVLVTGDHAPWACRKLKHGKKFALVKKIRYSEVLQEAGALFDLCPGMEMITGIANFKGGGEKMTELFRKHYDN